ncbi:response regulator [Clostridium sp. AN503]|uniref:response regulator transcription factor n=1 Tax=Clostridium sp. AN503 TaxID=3160598 RepID=UPI003457916A
MYKLMIADDEALERQALRHFIQNSKLEIVEILECANGIDAVKTALLKQPEICILDIKMPGLSGLEAMEQIKVVNKNCKIIFSTAYSYFDYAVKALQAGALDFMVKPVKKEKLIQVVNKAIDELDAEQNQEAYRSKITDLTYVLEKRILRELITGQTDEETLWFFDAMGIREPYGCIFFVRFKREISEEEKARLSKLLRSDLTAAGYTHLLYVHRKSIDFMVFSKTGDQTGEIAKQVEKILAYAMDSLVIPHTIGVGSWEEDLMQMEFSYLCAKEAVGEYVTAEQREIIVEEPSGGKDLKAVPPEIEAVCRYMKEHYSEKITLISIADSVGFSKYYISRLFKQHMGVTIIDYLIKVRLDRAKELLAKGDYSIKQISFMVGYSDPNYFTWSFKKYLGISPIKYRYFQNLGSGNQEPGV